MVINPPLNKKSTSFKNVPYYLLLLAALYFLPAFTLFYIVCGIYDVSRNEKLSVSLVHRYFFGNGLLTWALSPFNILMDICSLPFINKKIYKLEDLPSPCQEEIKQVLNAADDETILINLTSKVEKINRGMIFFKWYGKNIDNFFNVPEFHTDYKYIKTIGISVFNKKESTAEHFGPLRATIRVLYNINNVQDPAAYLEVGKTKNRWCENKLFIFDDTLSHQSFNKTDELRYCLFVDILRPSLSPWLFSRYVDLIAFLVMRIRNKFYGSWTPLN
jgi:aspartyl/asparaginyl beta-hydroxylase (cupin superfamily)